MKLEMDAFEATNAWDSVNLPQGRKPVGSKWIHKIEYKQNGDIERYKVRLIAQWYSQIEGFDYFHTYVQ